MMSVKAIDYRKVRRWLEMAMVEAPDYHPAG
jgi:hypothetical protein